MSAPNRGMGPFTAGDFSPDGMIDALPCTGCGQDTLSVREVAYRGDVVMWAYRCRPCQAKDDAEASVLRARHDELRTAGVSRETAKAAMERWFARG